MVTKAYVPPFTVKARKEDDAEMEVWGSYGMKSVACQIGKELVERHSYFAAVVTDGEGTSVEQWGT